jgi:tRNA 5-methylaminomethyl-2-thiouridine biosynthesis bifunctional protein
LLGGAELRLGTKALIDTENRQVNGEAFDTIILANGMAAETQAPWLGMEARLGQIEFVHGGDRPPEALVAGTYALCEGETRVWGATYETHEGGELVISAAARAENMAGLEKLDPPWRHGLSEGDEITSRAGVRASTYDWLPVAGPLPDHVMARELFAGVKHGRKPIVDAPLVPGIYLATGMGSRGFTWGPWLAAILAAQMFGEPAPASIGALKTISPMRFIYRALKRNV